MRRFCSQVDATRRSLSGSAKGVAMVASYLALPVFNEATGTSSRRYYSAPCRNHSSPCCLWLRGRTSTTECSISHDRPFVNLQQPALCAFSFCPQNFYAACLVARCTVALETRTARSPSGVRHCGLRVLAPPCINKRIVHVTIIAA